jgi:hypothetical protein
LSRHFDSTIFGTQRRLSGWPTARIPRSFSECWAFHRDDGLPRTLDASLWLAADKIGDTSGHFSHTRAVTRMLAMNDRPLTCGFGWSRLGESNPGPTHYESVSRWSTGSGSVQLLCVMSAATWCGRPQLAANCNQNCNHAEITSADLGAPTSSDVRCAVIRSLTDDDNLICLNLDNSTVLDQRSAGHHRPLSMYRLRIDGTGTAEHPHAVTDDRVPGQPPVKVSMYRCPACGATKRAADAPQCDKDGSLMEPVPKGGER